MLETILIPVLVFLAVMTFGVGVVMLLRGNRAPITSRLLVDETDPNVPTKAEHDRRVVKLLGRLGSAFSSQRPTGSLRAKLSRAGYYSEIAPAAYLGSKMLLLIVGLTMMTMAVMPLGLPLLAKLWVILLVSALLFFLPNLIVNARLSARRQAIQNHLPDAVDLLEVCVTSGMGLDMAWNAVSDEIRRVSPILADEMALTTLEMQLGATRTAAMRNLADRTQAEQFSSLVALLVQSERFGTSIADALGTFAQTMRETRSQRAEENAEKMAVKLLFPLVLFIFPVMLIVMVGPTAITLIRVMGNG